MVVYQIACQIILILPILFHEVFGEIYLKESIVDICNTELIVVIGVAITAMCMLPIFFRISVSRYRKISCSSNVDVFW